MKIKEFARNADESGYWFTMTDENDDEWTSWRMSKGDADRAAEELKKQNPDARWVRGIQHLK